MPSTQRTRNQAINNMLSHLERLAVIVRVGTAVLYLESMNHVDKYIEKQEGDFAAEVAFDELKKWTGEALWTLDSAETYEKANGIDDGTVWDPAKMALPMVQATQASGKAWLDFVKAWAAYFERSNRITQMERSQRRARMDQTIRTLEESLEVIQELYIQWLNEPGTNFHMTVIVPAPNPRS
ncbi:hypothetical protein HRR83_000366 [Exophiala dermatitidis]|uniref:Uncharacterized protein n=1 Tax=Exophiala dermatitidis TaxID=5970 RepID=A0AAN6F4S5_EXODE|nr:hypothetical protein HRR74_000368 [Exophiala dermatitidis]KAJ4528250.1 hypothetical protein HRR73_000872 [Exophiala dermatitidis]KAJ4531190.1 hypothetical protein HRR76_008864 [Exophiala dermatitidis]KAJ4558356.1 hypothetical protein HRR77_000367 [Exophiala dermatitidis]KAJ4581606.1 hypothetical protein HRR79_000626 [Exophiala dermatitidis]